MNTIVTAPPALPPPSGRPPEINLAPRDVEALADELLAYHTLFAPLFQRAEQRHWALLYLQGQLLELERKSIEPMALALEGGDVQALQQFISQGAWDAEAVLARHQEVVAQTLGDADTGVLIVGVARQWCGALAKVANCQASVVAGYASARGYTLVERRLYLPAQWFTPAYAARRQRYGVPPEQLFRTKPPLAGEMIAALRARGVLPFRWVTCDEGFGRDPVFLDQIAAADLVYLAEVPHTTRVWPQAVPAADAAPVEVGTLAALLPATAWTRQQIKEGAKGPLEAECAFVRAIAVRDGRPGPEVWVVLRRTLDDRPALKIYLSNAPADTPPATLVWLCGLRWPAESAIKEGKGEVGLDHYEVRGWVGWHHHVTLAFLAHHFLVRARLRVGEKSSGADGAAGAGVAPGRPAAAPPRRRDGPGAGGLRATPELCRLPLPSQAYAAPTQYFLTN